jgi:hypothetical protein
VTRRKYGSKIRDALFGQLSGRPGADTSGTVPKEVTPQNLTGMLMGAYGPSRRDPSRPDTAAAAAGLGVTQRTVQRWLSGQIQRPAPATVQSLARAARQASGTKQGRTAAIAAFRARQGQTPGKQQGMQLSFRGMMGPGDDYWGDRPRRANWQLNAQQQEDFLGAYEQGGENAALDWLADNSQEIYGVDPWSWGEISSLDVSGYDDQ